MHLRNTARTLRKIPIVYSEEILGKKTDPNARSPNANKADENRLGLIKHYRSLMPMAQEAHKPIFDLLPADGAIGSHQNAAYDAGINFEQLALEIAKRCNVTIPRDQFSRGGLGK